MLEARASLSGWQGDTNEGSELPWLSQSSGSLPAYSSQSGCSAAPGPRPRATPKCGSTPAGAAWSAQRLPRARFLPTDAESDRWHSSSPLSLSSAEEQATPPSGDRSVPGAIEAAARTLLANELGIDDSALVLRSAEAVSWSDASVGCPMEGSAYAQVVTPGNRLVFGYAGVAYAVHSDADGSSMLVCGGG